MTPKVKIGVSRQVVIPKVMYERLGLIPGDYLEVRVYQGSRLLMTPKTLVNKGRKKIDERLRQAEKDIRAGRVSGPFKTAKEIARHLNAI